MSAPSKHRRQRDLELSFDISNGLCACADAVEQDPGSVCGDVV